METTPGPTAAPPPASAPRSLGPASVMAVLVLTIAACAAVLLAPAPAGASGDEFVEANVRASRVGVMPYDGPITGQQVIDSCNSTLSQVACWSLTLSALLEGKGSGAAFDALEEMTRLSPLANTEGHPLAHGLGRFAFDAYGSVSLALSECSYKVFGGCQHGVLQNYFDSLGRPVTANDLDVCPTSPDFAEYTCLHGLGHGLMLNSNYAMNRSLDLCWTLGDWFARSSCLGGAFMENWVGWVDMQFPTAAGGHQHDDGPAPVFMISATDPEYPCNVVDKKYQPDCWLLQTSIILNFNGRSYEFAAHVCEGLTLGQVECFRSIGRDASAEMNRVVPRIETLCSIVPSGGNDCMRGALAEITYNAAVPQAGFETCEAMSTQFKEACYDELSFMSVGMVGKGQTERMCRDQVEREYLLICLRAI